MTILDTHAWLWHVSDPKRLSADAIRAVAEAPSLAISSISCWEVAEKVNLGKLSLDREIDMWIRQALSPASITAVDLSPRIAVRAAELRSLGLNGDLADRIIVATAIESGTPLITKDRNLRRFASRSSMVKAIW